LVGITSSGGNVSAWSAFFIGICSGIIYIIASKKIADFKIDDPLEASIVHGVCGFWSLIANGLFH
jgi:Amt family ammonium transporter